MLVNMGHTDLDLIRQFAREKSQPAFTALVHRHVDLVYSAALRQVRSPDLAGEVSQSVFLDLAREADKLKPDSILTAWLYQVTRRRAIDVIRRESRRYARERLAAEMAAMNTTANAADWTHIEPLLDEAMDALDETDRAAILLRFFENKSLREVGTALGASDDAAQKRVSRAIERLREFFAKRGVTAAALLPTRDHHHRQRRPSRARRTAGYHLSRPQRLDRHQSRNHPNRNSNHHESHRHDDTAKDHHWCNPCHEHRNRRFPSEPE